MFSSVSRRVLSAGAACVLGVSAVLALQAATAAPARKPTLAEEKPTGQEAIERGGYLVRLGGCNDCHTPGYFLGKPDHSRYLGGSDVGFEVPGLGTFVGPNLTPDRETGLGDWTRAEIVAAIQTGVRPDGRVLAPVMPWHAFAELTKSDMGAVVDFLASLTPVTRKVSGPFGPEEKADVFVMRIVPPDAGETPAEGRAEVE
ncbi:cytochrome C [Skermanella stibiiresistens]|uniref:cytochrome C n=1 Tax=Skermanella stibiiresistens TaxID=913326 RepID=UPI000A07A595|nr:cytochrome C [Skermanella stibiiresistens]